MTSNRPSFSSQGASPRVPAGREQPAHPPIDVPGYETRRFLGAGAYGEVWVAIDRNTGRQVAIKFFQHRDAVDWPLLSREVEKLVFLSADRYVVQLLDVGWDSDPAYYVMEYVENGSLDDQLRRHGPLPVGEAVEVFRDIAIGVSHAHNKGVLHCDLKPANILLDQDHKPRLADFGQSRLTHEQRPALGTLFYMAPEQADLKAVPDALWDVYALGALLYCMLTGAPPHRNQQAISELDSAAGLSQRLAVYRNYMRETGPVTQHRNVAGIDRALCEILERCLDVDTSQRFPHVVGVLEALEARDQSRIRRPLQVLGIVGPLLLLLTMCLFGYRGYLRAIGKSEQLVTQSSREANKFAAEGVARNVANELDKRFRAIADTADNRRLIRLLEELTSDPGTDEQLSRLVQGADDEATLRVRQEFIASPRRQPLQSFVDELLADRRLPPVASWFVTDGRGTMLAAAFDSEPDFSPLGENFSYRSYFHGGERDSLPRQHGPLQETVLSAPFRSTATRTYKVAISTPISAAPTTLGVLVMTLELGEFVRFQTSPDQCAVLIDGRDNDYRGIIFQHPLYEALLLRFRELPFDISDDSFRADVEELRNGTHGYYEDPLSRHELGQGYAGAWIVGSAPVSFERLTRAGNRVLYDTGLLLAVERRLSSATEPVVQLGHTLFRDGIMALAVVIAVSAALWYFVLRMQRQSHRVRRRLAAVDADHATSVHSRETLEMPTRP